MMPIHINVKSGVENYLCGLNEKEIFNLQSRGCMVEIVLPILTTLKIRIMGSVNYVISLTKDFFSVAVKYKTM